MTVVAELELEAELWDEAPWAVSETEPEVVVTKTPFLDAWNAIAKALPPKRKEMTKDWLFELSKETNGGIREGEKVGLHEFIWRLLQKIATQFAYWDLDGEDLYQECWLRIWDKRWHFIYKKTQLSTWIWTVCHNHMRNIKGGRTRYRGVCMTMETDIKDTTRYEHDNSAMTMAEIVDELTDIYPEDKDLIVSLFYDNRGNLSYNPRRAAMGLLDPSFTEDDYDAQVKHGTEEQVKQYKRHNARVRDLISLKVKPAFGHSFGGKNMDTGRCWGNYDKSNPTCGRCPVEYSKTCVKQTEHLAAKTARGDEDFSLPEFLDNMKTRFGKPDVRGEYGVGQHQGQVVKTFYKWGEVEVVVNDIQNLVQVKIESMDGSPPKVQEFKSSDNGDVMQDFVLDNLT